MLDTVRYQDASKYSRTIDPLGNSVLQHWQKKTRQQMPFKVQQTTNEVNEYKA